MPGLTVMGVDPGLANLGWSYLDVGSLKVTDLGLLETKKASKKLRLNAADDFFGRALLQAQAFTEVVQAHERPTFIAMEAFSAPRGASAAAKLAAAGGIVIGVAASLGVPIVIVHRADVYATIKIPHATKEQVIAFAKARDPNLKWPVKSKCEHPADACVIALTAVKTPGNAAMLAVLKTAPVQF